MNLFKKLRLLFRPSDQIVYCLFWYPIFLCYLLPRQLLDDRLMKDCKLLSNCQHGPFTTFLAIHNRSHCLYILIVSPVLRPISLMNSIQKSTQVLLVELKCWLEIFFGSLVCLLSQSTPYLADLLCITFQLGLFQSMLLQRQVRLAWQLFVWPIDHFLISFSLSF